MEIKNTYGGYPYRYMYCDMQLINNRVLFGKVLTLWVYMSFVEKLVSKRI